MLQIQNFVRMNQLLITAVIQKNQCIFSNTSQKTNLCMKNGLIFYSDLSINKIGVILRLLKAKSEL